VVSGGGAWEVLLKMSGERVCLEFVVNENSVCGVISLLEHS